MTLADRVTSALAEMPTVSTKVGILVQRSGSSVVVNVGETSVLLPFTAQQLPPADHPVQIQSLNGVLTVTGSARPLPGRGIVTALGSPRVTVAAFDRSYVLPVANFEPTLNQEVSIAWDVEGGIVTGPISAPTTVVPPAANAGPGAQAFHPPPFTVADTASWQSGRWTKDEVWASDSLTGFWFPGSGVVDSIPDTARILSAAIYLSPSRTGGAAPNLQLHNALTRPGTQPTFVGDIYNPPGRSGWQPIPTGWIDLMKAGSYGIGVNHGGYNIFKARGQDGLSGALDLAWEA